MESSIASNQNSLNEVRFTKVLTAFLLAIILPAIWASFEWNSHIFSLYWDGKRALSEALGTFIFRFGFLYIIGVILATFLGMPLFYALRKILPFRLPLVCLIAALIAVFPNIFIEFLSMNSSSEGHYSIGDCTIIENGVRTACGWKHFWINNVGLVALKGALAGLVFWFILNFRQGDHRELDDKNLYGNEYEHD